MHKKIIVVLVYVAVVVFMALVVRNAQLPDEQAGMDFSFGSFNAILQKLAGKRVPPTSGRTTPPERGDQIRSLWPVASLNVAVLPIAWMYSLLTLIPVYCATVREPTPGGWSGGVGGRAHGRITAFG